MAKKGVFPEKTKRATEWAVCTYHTWRWHRNEQLPDNICSDEILLRDDNSPLCHWLCVSHFNGFPSDLNL